MSVLRRTPRIALPAIAFALVGLALTALASNIDPNNDGSRYAWGESVGWINMKPASGAPGVDVKPYAVTGYAWGEAIGWVSMSCSNDGSCATINYGVTNDNAGNLAGYAWSESKGWISFSCANSGSCGTVNYGVTIDGSGKFHGHAWGESIGWISFNCANRATCGTVPYLVQADACDISWGNDGAPTFPWIKDGAGLEGATTGADACDSNDDNNGCSDGAETGASHVLGGQRDPLNPWDFADMWVPALPAPGARNGAISIADAVAVTQWIGAFNGGPPNVNGNDYDSDTNGNGVEDGAEYDRSPSTTPGQPWRTNAPNGAVSIADALLVVNSIGDHC